VGHVSYYEAAAFAAWPAAGCRPRPSGKPPSRSEGQGLRQTSDEAWQWTASPYVAYPGFKPGAGRAGRVQRQVHDQPDGPAGRGGRDAARPHAAVLSQLLPPGPALGVHGGPLGRRHERAGSRDRRRRLDLPGRRPGGPDGRAQDLPAKYFYDAEGSRLFEAICDLPEYYPTRTETALLRRIAPEIAARVMEGAALVEFGSGASTKTRILLDAMPQLAVYVPIDISKSALDEASARDRRDYPGLSSRRWSTISRARSGCRRRRGAAGDRLLPGLDDRQFRAAEAEEFLRGAHGTAGRRRDVRGRGRHRQEPGRAGAGL
jgi:hypothetical protein